MGSKFLNFAVGEKKLIAKKTIIKITEDLSFSRNLYISFSCIEVKSDNIHNSKMLSEYMNMDGTLNMWRNWQQYWGNIGFKLNDQNEVGKNPYT